MEQPAGAMRRTSWAWPLAGSAVLCGVLGAAINSLAAGVAGSLQLGRVATLPIAILFGPWLGLLSAAIGLAASRPRANAAVIALCLTEAALIGAAARRGTSPVIAGAI